MRKKILIIIVAALFIIILSSVTFVCVKKILRHPGTGPILYSEAAPVLNRNNPFCVKASLAFYDSLAQLSSLDEKNARVIQYRRSATLIKLGREQEAVNALQPLVDKLKSNAGDDFATEAQRSLALAYLRLGERNNCISNHSSGSCIFPIRDKGIYLNASASRQAITNYQEVLEKDSSDIVSRWMLNIAYMTIGEYPAKVPAPWLIPGLDRDTSSCKVKPFRDMAGDLKINSFRNQAGGSIVDDFNNDGYLDIITSSWDLEEGMHFFKNNGDGTFTDISKASGLSEIKGGLNIIQADYNNDGYPDILVLRGAWLREFGRQPKSLLRNNGDGTFTDVTGGKWHTLIQSYPGRCLG